MSIESIWDFIPATERKKYDQIAELVGVSRSGAIALKMCADALKEYCPPEDRAKVVGALAAREIGAA